MEIGPPVINKIAGPQTVSVQDSACFECLINPPAIGPLQFEWWCSRGEFVQNNLPKVIWSAPESSGSAFVCVKVTDGKGRQVSDFTEVSVLPRKVTFVNWDGLVRAGELLVFFDSCRANYRLYGRISADTGNMYLIFLNHTNFLRWSRNENYEFRIRRRANDPRPFYDTIPASDLYYLILDNSGGSRDCGYRVTVELESP